VSRAGAPNSELGDPLAAVTPVASRRAAAQVADQIVLAVRDQRLQPGSGLPSERELAERFGVSRPTIREALAALELAGIVQSYQGRGTTIIGTSSQVAMWGVEILPPQIFEARLAIEPELARLAAEKRYPEDMAYLQQVIKDLEAQYQSGSYNDHSLHRAIARAARNPILERALEDALVPTQTPLWLELQERALLAAAARKGHVEEARQVVNAIDQGKANQAAKIWRRHLVFFRDEMLGRAHETTAQSVPRRPR
jgi:DNA-binding FadR family transcriptional regulator